MRSLCRAIGLLVVPLGCAKARPIAAEHPTRQAPEAPPQTQTVTPVAPEPPAGPDLPSVDVPLSSRTVCGDECAGGPRITIAADGTVTLNGEPVQWVPTSHTLPDFGDRLDRAVLDARGPEFRDWHARASNGGQMSYWLALDIAGSTSMCDVEAVLALSERTRAVAGVLDGQGQRALVGFAFRTLHPRHELARERLRVALTSQGLFVEPHRGPRVQVDLVGLRAAADRAFSEARGRDEPLAVIVDADPELHWRDVVEVLAALGPMTVPHPARLPTLWLHVRPPIMDEEFRRAATLETTARNRCELLPSSAE